MACPEGSSPHGLLSANRKLYFAADDGVHGIEPWKFYKGRVTLVQDVVTGPDSSDPRLFGFLSSGGAAFIHSGDFIFFLSGTAAEELWSLRTSSYCPSSTP